MQDTRLREIGLKIEREMWAQQLRLTKLAEMAEVSNMTLYRIIKGDNYDIKNLLKVTKALKIRIELTTIN